MHYPSTPPIICAHKASAVLAVVIVLGAVSSMLAFSTAKVSQAGMRAADSSKITLQAQQYAASEADLLSHSPYDKLSSQAKSVISGSKYSSGSSGSWVDSFPASGTAPYDGIIVCTSRWNTYMSITISGKVRTEVSRRDKYGQGRTNATCPIAKGEPYSISGAGRICFFKL